MRGWSMEEVRKLKKMTEDKCGVVQIAENLGRSAWAVYRARSRLKEGGKAKKVELWDKQGGLCFYTGLPMIFQLGKYNTAAITDADGGEMVLACRVICDAKRRWKMTDREFMTVCRECILKGGKR